MRQAGSVVACCVLFALAGPSPAQEVVEVPALRERVVAAQTETLSQDGVQYIYVASPQSQGNRPWRLWLRAPDATEEIEIRTAAADIPVDRVPADAARRGVWSDSLKAGEVYLAVPETAGPDVPLASWLEATVEVQTPVGVTNLIPLAQDALTLRLKQLVPGVGRLALLKSAATNTPGPALDTSYIYCTAFLVSADYALTAGHCVDVGLDGRFPELVLGYLGGDPSEASSRHNVTLAAVSRPLDLAVLRLDPPRRRRRRR